MRAQLSVETLHQQVQNSQLDRKIIDNVLMEQDIWLLTTLGYTEQECRIRGNHYLYFTKFTLPWLKLLAKLTAKAAVREGHSLGRVALIVNILKQLDNFLLEVGCTQPQTVTDPLLQQFISQSNSRYRRTTILYATKLWAEEQWLKLSYTPRKVKQSHPKIETIPEEVLYQIYEKFDLFPPTLERLFRLQLVLGCRIGEMLTMPRQCLKFEGNHWFLLRWVQKRKHWRFSQIHPLVAQLVQEQQRFLNNQFGDNCDFENLFCKTSAALMDGAKAGGRFQVEPVYIPQVITYSSICEWLKSFSQVACLKDKYANKFYLTSHMFRRTKASIMAHCEAEDEYIAAVLGHSSLDMLPHYRQHSLVRLEKEAQTKGYVDMYGRITTIKPKKLRYERLADLLKVSTPLGECHRPTMLGDCQYRYACLGCIHHRVTLFDKLSLEADIKNLEQDLEQAQIAEKQRRVTEIQRLLQLLNNRLQGLRELENFIEDDANGST
ncbi:site-specific integrase [Mastigocoleus testarum]|uniref:Integrase n=1 Tax=Mastigocoleus testarum BC008 TaxID=371196 RepID=A0A0V7ZF23_9CYAN|nr:site-specific integrase [Mastigocoleus testarum]KST63069.1 integrase [Mastigocoleus testarum BC008]KST69072.1 integrase [Mastigocoleus testarum BC008]